MESANCQMLILNILQRTKVDAAANNKPPYKAKPFEFKLNINSGWAAYTLLFVSAKRILAPTGTDKAAPHKQAKYAGIRKFIRRATKTDKTNALSIPIAMKKL
jgi:hypothetical protein